jgi:hypothetical protein
MNNFSMVTQGAVPALPGVVAVELAERSLGALVVRLDEAFEHDLRSRGKRQAGQLPRNYSNTLS